VSAESFLICCWALPLVLRVLIAGIALIAGFVAGRRWSIWRRFASEPRR
jgi:hypothetical protein